ncbi:hypothetical protein [Bradyrhizobium vignae]|uniref:Secreted protein n=1 Tax=Bradyrhizobium vignae TaxID=1549949 RepID=A0ABS3ZTG9_9BRAD|nr:hypothetical protein [Bradyrhizobium vignae]MBP0111060.1 hypothetical protein [Bradyrhizobium vignae]
MTLKRISEIFLLVLIVWTTDKQAFAQASYLDGEPKNECMVASDCKCPPGYRDPSCKRISDRVNGCYCSIVTTQQCSEAAVKENMRWIFDAGSDQHRANVRGTLNRAVIARDVDSIRASYQEGQKHNPSASAMIDDCDDMALLNVAYSVAENFRLKSCSDSPPARSATCADLTNNLTWSLIDAADCAPYARDKIIEGLDSAAPLEVRAALIRQGLKIAQSHNQEVSDSIDWISNRLVVQIAEQVVKATNSRALAGWDNWLQPRRYCRGATTNRSR